MGRRKRVWTKVLVTSILLSGTILFGGMKVGATDFGSEGQISVLQENEKCYEFRNGILTLKGIVDREQIDNFEYKESVRKIVAEKGTVLPSDCSKLFAGWEKDVINKTRFCYVRSVDLSNADTSNITDMSYMFSRCDYLTSLDISNFDTSNVTDMSYMFWGSDKLTELDLSHFDTRNVTNMSWMFYGCFDLTSVNLSHFDTSKVEDMSYMFFSCGNLIDLDLSNFDTSKVTDMSYMFYSNNYLINLDISNFDTSRVKNMFRMFAGCGSLGILDVSSFDTSEVTDMSSMYQDCRSLIYLDLSNFDTRNVTNMQSMFEDCFSLKYLDIGGFDTRNVTKISHIFKGCRNLISLDLSGFTLGGDWMFARCDSLEKIIIGEKFVNIEDSYLLPNLPSGWARGSIIGERISGDGSYAVFENNGLNTYYKLVPSRSDVSKVFTDIPTGEWFKDAVQFVYDRSIMNGISGTTFGPRGVLTREQFITVLYNMEGCPVITFKTIFGDVTDSTLWYAKSVTWAAENKITSGIGNNLFGTGKEITREQLATLLYNYAQQKGGYKVNIDENLIAGFPDADKIDSWASAGMKWAITNGVMGGKAGNDGQKFLDPLGKATRAECAQMIKNLKENAVK